MRVTIKDLVYSCKDALMCSGEKVELKCLQCAYEVLQRSLHIVRQGRNISCQNNNIKEQNWEAVASIQETHIYTIKNSFWYITCQKLLLFQPYNDRSQ